MKNLTSLLGQAQTILKENSPAILTAIGVSGTLSTAYFAGRASWYASRRLGEGPADLSNREKFEVVWDLYIPPTISAIVTVGCIIGANHASSKRTAAAYSILAISEKTFEEYRSKVIEQHGKNKEQKIRDEVAQDRVANNPPDKLVIVGNGTVLCYEMHTGRYFNSDMQTLRKAQNDINNKLLGDMYVTIGQFYYLIGLPSTSNSGDIGWTSDKLMDLHFSAVMSEDSRPCLAFEYNYIKPL